MKKSPAFLIIVCFAVLILHGCERDEAGQAGGLHQGLVNLLGPGATPTPGATATPAPAPTATPTPLGSATPGPTATPTQTPTPGPTATPTRTPTPMPSPTPTPGPADPTVVMLNGGYCAEWPSADENLAAPPIGTISLPIQVHLGDPGRCLGTVNVTVTFSPSVLQCASARFTWGSYPFTGGLVTANCSTPGRVTLAVAQSVSTTCSQQDYIVGYLNLDVLRLMASDICIESVSLKDADAVTIPVDRRVQSCFHKTSSTCPE